MAGEGIIIRDQRRPGDDVLIVDLHRRGYAAEDERFRETFFAFVGETLAEAQLDDPARGTVWFAERGSEVLGCAAMVNRGDRGQLRFVVLVPEARGLGLGRTLVDRALQHARRRGYGQVYLETTDGLEASMSIYEKLGFVTVHDAPEPLWHGEGRRIEMTLDLKEDAR